MRDLYSTYGIMIITAIFSFIANPNEEQKLVLEWFDLVNRKNTLIRYESELVIRYVFALLIILGWTETSSTIFHPFPRLLLWNFNKFLDVKISLFSITSSSWSCTQKVQCLEYLIVPHVISCYRWFHQVLKLSNIKNVLFNSRNSFKISRELSEIWWRYDEAVKSLQCLL